MSAILQALRAIQENQTVLSTGLANVTKRLDQIAPETAPGAPVPKNSNSNGASLSSSPLAAPVSPSASPSSGDKENAALQAQKSGFTSRIILT